MCAVHEEVHIVVSTTVCLSCACNETKRQKISGRWRGWSRDRAKLSNWGGKGASGYARELKSLHARTVMYGDCACVTCLAASFRSQRQSRVDFATILSSTSTGYSTSKYSS